MKENEKESGMVVICYDIKRAIFAIVFPLEVLLLLIIRTLSNWNHSILDYSMHPFGVLLLISGIIWWIYASYPSALSVLTAKNKLITMHEGRVCLPNFSLEYQDLTSLRMKKTPLRPAEILLVTKSETIGITTSYQKFGSIRSAEEIFRMMQKAQKTSVI